MASSRKVASPLPPAADPWDGVSVWIRHAGRYACKPGWSLPPFVSGHYTLFYFEKGHGGIECDGAHMDARPGQLFIFRPGRRYHAWHDPKRPVTVLSVGFLMPRDGGADALRPWALPDRMALNAGQRRTLRAQYEEVIAALARKTDIARLEARGALLKLVACALQLKEDVPATRQLSGPDKALASGTRMGAVVDYIEAHLSEKLTLKGLAARAHLSPVYFASLFRRETGRAPMAWVRARRMAAAKALLLESDAGVEAVARAVGFADPFHFSRAFRKETGQAPSAFRESFKNPFLR